MTRLFRLGLLVSLVVALAAFATPRQASAHPMGNFSINRYSALTVGQDKVEILYIVDKAEIPTFQELVAIRPDHSSDLTDEERNTYITRQADKLVQGLSLSVDGTSVSLSRGDSSLTFPPGNGGLPTMRLELHFSAPLSGATSGRIEYRDSNFANNIGWREVIAVPAEGTMFKELDVPQTDKTKQLTQYNPNASSTPLDTTSAKLIFAPGTAPAPAAQPSQSEQGAVDWAKQRIDDVASLISQDNLPFGALLLGLVIAFFWGAGHALSPGHGKAVVAAYLVGTRGTARHATILGLTVTISHTIGVFTLGLVVLFAANYIVPDQLYPIIGFASGMFIVVMGVVMFAQRFRLWRGAKAAHVHDHTETPDHDHNDDHDHMHAHGIEHAHDHDHTHEHSDDHDHAHEHVHDHDHGHDPVVPHTHGPFGKPHTHVPAAGSKVTMGSLLALGITGGIIPCPTALVVLLAAIAYHRVALGLAWILSFSLGLAAVLTGLGLLVVYGRGLLSRFDRTRFRFGVGLMARLPMASAVMVAVLGFLIAFQSLQIR